MKSDEGQAAERAAETKTLLGVEYRHCRTADGGDLYVTEWGLPFLRHLFPEQWYEKEWFRKSREKLLGTSRVYRVRTKPDGGREGKDLVVKWCRVGEDVPVDTFTLNKFIEAEFNTPYEEFSLLTEMRQRAKKGTILTHKPLAIFVPAKRMELWQTGRSQSKIAQKKAKFRDVELDIYRQYILIYEWIKGVASTSEEASRAAEEDGEEGGAAFAREMLHRSITDMWQAGFRVLDVKPEHVIVRPKAGGGLVRDREGRVRYALVDFELLARTPAYEERVKRMRRQDYLERQRDRFAEARELPGHLHGVRILGVDYIHGDCESTNGKLWVVGRDPKLFDYFQPERWRRTKRESLSDSAQVYRTTTKDEIQLVWKVSHVGERPDEEATEAHRAHGFNSPFEEVAYALELSKAGVASTYPRAIYMLGHLSTLPPEILDPRRYESHAALRMPGGEPVLQRTRNYITVWGYWNGLDEDLAGRDAASKTCRGINARQALAAGRITPEEHDALMEKVARLLASAGFESTTPKDTHFLLTENSTGELVRDPDGTAAVRICNFEFLRKLGSD